MRELKHNVTITLTSEQFRQLDQAAQRHGTDMVRLVRWLVLEEIKKND